MVLFFKDKPSPRPPAVRPESPPLTEADLYVKPFPPPTDIAPTKLVSRIYYLLQEMMFCGK